MNRLLLTKGSSSSLVSVTQPYLMNEPLCRYPVTRMCCSFSQVWLDSETQSGLKTIEFALSTVTNPITCLSWGLVCVCESKGYLAWENNCWRGALTSSARAVEPTFCHSAELLRITWVILVGKVVVYLLDGSMLWNTVFTFQQWMDASHHQFPNRVAAISAHHAVIAGYSVCWHNLIKKNLKESNLSCPAAVLTWVLHATSAWQWTELPQTWVSVMFTALRIFTSSNSGTVVCQ